MDVLQDIIPAVGRLLSFLFFRLSAPEIRVRRGRNKATDYLKDTSGFTLRNSEAKEVEGCTREKDVGS